MKYTLGLSKKAQLTRKQLRKYLPFFLDVFKKDRVNENISGLHKAFPFNQILAMQGNGIAKKMIYILEF